MCDKEVHEYHTLRLCDTCLLIIQHVYTYVNKYMSIILNASVTNTRMNVILYVLVREHMYDYHTKVYTFMR